MSRNLEMKFKKLKQSQLWNHKNPNLLELDSDVLYEYNNIHIHSGCTLTVKPWLGRTEYKRIRKEHLNKTYSIDPHKIDILISYWNNHTIPHYSTDIQQLILSYISKESRDFLGGRLLLKCKGNIIIEKGGKIDVDSCGYTSGTYYTSGESCKNMGTFNNISPNVGGGGAGLARCGAGGGGYGTIGGHGKMTDDVKSAIEHTGLRGGVNKHYDGPGIIVSKKNGGAWVRYILHGLSGDKFGFSPIVDGGHLFNPTEAEFKALITQNQIQVEGEDIHAVGTAHVQYEDIANSHQSYNIMMADYYYDLAVEEAREFRASKLLKEERKRAKGQKERQRKHKYKYKYNN